MFVETKQLNMAVTEKQLEKIKEEYAKGKGYREARLLEQDAFAGQHINSLMQRAFNAALELAAEKAQVKRTNDSLEWKMIAEDDHFIEVSKNSILSLKLNS